jgi:multiple sugar transport system permease protein
MGTSIQATEAQAKSGARAGQRTRRGRRGVQPRLAPWGFLAPAMVLFTLFAFVPIGLSVFLSFQDVHIFGGGRWIGGHNYTRMVGDSLFWHSLKNTAVFTVGNRPLPGRTILRGVYVLPIAVSGVVVALTMAWIFNGDYGVFNNALGGLGIPRQQWLTSPSLAMVTLVAAVVWSRIGFCLVIYLAALQSIPTELMEAATQDGASPWQRFRHVTLPLLSPTTFLLLVVNVIFSLHAFDIIYILTGGGPGFATTVLLQYIYTAAFSNGAMGYASAMGVVLTLILLVFTVIRAQSARARELDFA